MPKTGLSRRIPLRGGLESSNVSHYTAPGGQLVQFGTPARTVVDRKGKPTGQTRTSPIRTHERIAV